MCICYPPHVLCAAAILAGSMYLKIQLSVNHLSREFRDEHPELAGDDMVPSVRHFPWKELFDCEYAELSRIYEFTLQFIKLIKYKEKN